MDFQEVNPYSYSPVLRAVQLQDADALLTLLSRGHSPDSVDNRGLTPLHLIVKLIPADPGCCERMVAALLDAEANINTRAHNGITATSLCVQENKKDLLKVLLSRGADPTIGDMEDVTPLHVACMKGNLPIAKLLLGHGANVNAQDFNGYSPLHEAVTNGSYVVTQLLLQYKADVLLMDMYDHIPLHFLAHTGNQKLFSLLVNATGSVNINRQNCDGLTLLMLAAQRGNSLVVKELIAMNADPNIFSKDLLLALHFSCEPNEPNDVFIPIVNYTSREAIEHSSQHKKWSLTKTHSYVNNVVCLLIETESKLNLEAFFSKKFSLDVYDCPIKLTVREMRIYFKPIGFLLRVKTSDFGIETLAYLKMLIKNGLSVNGVNQDGVVINVMPPLCAILYAQFYETIPTSLVLDIMEMLVASGADVDVHFINPVTLIPSKSGFVEGLQFLLVHSKVAEPFLIISDICSYIKHTEWNFLMREGLIRSILYLLKLCPITELQKSLIALKESSESSRVEFPSEIFGSVVNFSLQCICRKTIRKEIREVGRLNVIDGIEQLKMPKSVKDYLRYKTPI